MMNGFPPEEKNQVTLANWRKPPFNRWAFNHVNELIPTATIRSARDHEDLGCAADNALADFRLSLNGDTLGVQGWLDRTFSDAIVVLKNGKIVFEQYSEGQDAVTPHIWMSVSKSVLGLVAGALVGKGQLDVGVPLLDVIPELAGSGFDGASVRDLLDMRVGVKFDEDYHATSGAIIEYRKSHLWDPIPVGEQPSDLRRFFSALVERDGAHNGRFHYVSPNTDLLGWVFERVSGRRYADLVSELLWQPIGAEHDAYITVDRLGAPRCAGGLCAVPRDMARLGRLFVTGGQSRGTQVIPGSWLDDIIQNGSAAAWKEGDFYDLFEGADMHYRSKWYVLRGARPLVYGVGVFGQNVFIDVESDLVIAKSSSQPLPLDKEFLSMTLAGVEVIRNIFK